MSLPDAFRVIVGAAIFFEAVTQTIIWVYEKGWSPNRLIALFVAVIGAVLFGLDGFALIGLEVPWELPIWVERVVVGIFTGIPLARGANVVHDLFRFIENGKLGLAEKANN